MKKDFVDAAISAKVFEEYNKKRKQSSYPEISACLMSEVSLNDKHLFFINFGKKKKSF